MANNDRGLAWSVAGGWGSVPAGSEYYGYDAVESIPGYTPGVPAGMEHLVEQPGYGEMLPTIVPKAKVPQPIIPIMPPAGFPPGQGIGISGPFNGEAPGAESLAVINGQVAPYGQPQIAPLIGAAAVGLGGVLTVGFLRTLLARYGAVALRLLIGAGLFAAFMELFDDDDATVVRVKPKRKRYTFTMNSRIGTIAKSGKAMLKILKRHKKVINQLLPDRKPFPAKALARQYLSAAERKMLK